MMAGSPWRPSDGCAFLRPTAWHRRGGRAMVVTIYHTPRCSKSRATLALLQDLGIAPTIVEYLNDTPDAKTLDALLKKLKIEPRELMRRKIGRASCRERVCQYV